MTMDRREFVTTGLGAIAAAATPLAQTKQGDALASIEIFFKGQFVYIREGRELYVSVLKPKDGHPHNGYIFLKISSLDRSRTVPKPDKEVADGNDSWYGWNFAGQVTLLRGDRRVRLARPLARTSARAGKVPWPVPVNDDAKWNDHAYIPQLEAITPGCSVKDKWRDECLGRWALDESKLRPRKPCTPADAVAVWGWRDQKGDLTHISAVTDLVSYPILTFPRETKLTLRMEREDRSVLQIPMVADGAAPIAALCAPPRDPNKSRRVPYTAAYKSSDFENVYRILEPTSYPEMVYVTQSADPSKVEGTDCFPPYRVLDDDIFCPGGEPPPRP